MKDKIKKVEDMQGNFRNAGKRALMFSAALDRLVSVIYFIVAIGAVLIAAAGGFITAMNRTYGMEALLYLIAGVLFVVAVIVCLVFRKISKKTSTYAGMTSGEAKEKLKTLIFWSVTAIVFGVAAISFMNGNSILILLVIPLLELILSGVIKLYAAWKIHKEIVPSEKADEYY